MTADLTAPSAPLAAAAADLTRLLPSRVVDPVRAGLLLDATAAGLELAGADHDRAVSLRVAATVHTDGRVLVPARPLAETLRAIDAPDVRLVVEGARLAVRTPSARFALPLLDPGGHPGTPAPPPHAGMVAGQALRAALAPVAAAASRDDALPVFTGIRIRGEGDRLVMLATDRYRLALAALPWQPAGGAPPLDALVPGPVLAEVARLAGRAAEVGLHGDAERFGLAWDGASVSTALLAAPFPDGPTRRLLDVAPCCTVEVDADALAGAVRRAAPYGGPFGVVSLRVGDAEVRVLGQDPLAGESDEAVKATVDGDRPTPTYQSRYLADALRGFAGCRVTLRVQEGMRATAVSAAEPRPGGVELTCLVMPAVPPAGGAVSG